MDKNNSFNDIKVRVLKVAVKRWVRENGNNI